MINITEEDNLHKQWYIEAHDKSMSLEILPKFLKKLTEEYNHDYGTICHALTAGAIATIWAMNRTPNGGITGFQASCIMWEFIKNWMSYKGSMRLIQYDKMLYPQYEDDFQKKISQKIWNRLKEQARKLLVENPDAVDSVKKHWESIVDGNIPFGFTIENKSY